MPDTNYKTLQIESHVRVADAAYQASITEFDNSLVVLGEAQDAINKLAQEQQELLRRLHAAKENLKIAEEHSRFAEERMHRAYDERFPTIKQKAADAARQAEASVDRAAAAEMASKLAPVAA